MERSDVLNAVKRLSEAIIAALLLDDVDLAEDFMYALHALVLQAKNYDRYNAAATRCYFLRPSLVWPEGSAWAQVRRHHSDLSLINFLRVDWQTFYAILANIDPDKVAWREGFTDATRTDKRPGRPTFLDAADVLALTLAYLTSTSSQKQLEMLFGMTKTSISDMLWNEGLPLLLETLAHMPAAAVTWPTFEQQREHADLVEMAYGPCPLGARVFGVMDGLRLRCTNPSSVGVQNLFYNGWEGYTNIVNCIVFDMLGRVIDASINRPGTLNDYTMASGVFMKLSSPDWTLPGYTVAADNGYVSNATLHTVAHLQYAPEGEPARADARRSYVTWQLTVRKAAEWGMHILQSLFPRLTVMMPGSADKRQAILTACIKLNNVIANTERGNQISLRGCVHPSLLRVDLNVAQQQPQLLQEQRLRFVAQCHQSL
jgi:hypothetical protein